MTTDTTERGLEDLVVRAMTGRVDLLSPPYQATDTAAPVAGGTGWLRERPRKWIFLHRTPLDLECGFDGGVGSRTPA